MSTRYSWPLRSKEGPSRKESTACPGLLASTQPEGWLCSRRVSGRRLNKVVETSVVGGYRLMVALLLALLADHGKGFLCNSRYIGGELGLCYAALPGIVPKRGQGFPQIGKYRITHELRWEQNQVQHKSQHLHHQYSWECVALYARTASLPLLGHIVQNHRLPFPVLPHHPPMPTAVVHAGLPDENDDQSPAQSGVQRANPAKCHCRRH